ncbi:10 TM acyl transferase domain found in Cas1p-domain-containing protein, partial [Microdochium trichocladiopsis]
DPHRCNALLKSGTWVRHPSGPTEMQRWQPAGCQTHDYKTDELRQCFDGHKIVLVGDSTVRQLYVEIAKRFDIHTYHKAAWHRHQNLDFQSENVTVEFIWDPWLNSTQSLSRMAVDSESHSHKVSADLADPSARIPISLLVAGSPGLWATRYGGEQYMDIFKDRLDQAQNLFATIFGQSWAPNELGYNMRIPLVLLTPVQVLDHQHLEDDRATTMTSQRVTALNDYLQQTDISPRVLWAHNMMLDGIPGKYQNDGLHVLPHVANERANLLFNAVCNWKLLKNSTTGDSCCTMNKSGLSAVEFGLIVLTLGFGTLSGKKIMGQGVKGALQKPYQTFLWFSIIGVIARLMNGTSFFLREPRQPDPIAIAYLIAIWLATSLLDKSISKATPNRKATTLTGFLSSQQCEELKGFMQGVILVYHYYHGSQVLWIYKGIRVLVSTYLFLSAYGHTTYFLATGDTSLRRVAVVIFRTHALAIRLMLSAGTTYTDYYFIPVLTFWFLICWMSFRLKQHKNRILALFCIKLALCAFATDVLILTPGILEKVVGVSNMILPLRIDHQELRFRLGLERYIVYAGSLLAYTVHKYRGVDDHEGFHHPAFKTKFRRHTIAAAGTLILLYGVVLWFTTEKGDYNRAHPFISWIPILCIVGLRNMHAWVRGSHMRLPAKLGRLSLETYLLQYHMLLGDNATTRLRI